MRRGRGGGGSLWCCGVSDVIEMHVVVMLQGGKEKRGKGEMERGKGKGRRYTP